MLLPEIDSDRDSEDAVNLVLAEMRKRYPGARKWTVRTVRGEVQAFAKGVQEFTEDDRAAVETEMRKARTKR